MTKIEFKKEWEKKKAKIKKATELMGGLDEIKEDITTTVKRELLARGFGAKSAKKVSAILSEITERAVRKMDDELGKSGSR